MHRRISKGIGLAAVAAVCLMSPAAALAADPVEATGTVAPGSLEMTTPEAPTFGTTLDGTDQTPEYTIPFTLKDARGTGGGWNTTIMSTQFTNADGKTLAVDASSVSGVTSAAVGGTAELPGNSVTYGVGGLSIPTDAAQPIKFFNAADGTGMGNFTLTPTVKVSVPAKSYKGAYKSTVTIAAVSGP
jgi:hypothetical protein